MGVIICGLPHKADGEFYCPYCDFTSYDIEDFATSMCWDCAISPEEEQKEEIMAAEVAKTYSIDDVKVGDEVTVTRTLVVSSIDTHEGILGYSEKGGTHHSGGGRTVRVAQRKSYYGTGYLTKDLPSFTITNIRKTEPANWSSLAGGQVWKDDTGALYLTVTQPGDGVMAFTVDNKPVNKTNLKTKPGLKRVYPASA